MMPLTLLELRVSAFMCPHFSKGLGKPLKNVLEAPRVWDIPMTILFKFLEFRQVLGHLGIRKPPTVSAVISHRKCNEMISHNATDIQIAMQTFQGLIIKKFMFCVSHGMSCIVSLT